MTKRMNRDIGDYLLTRDGFRESVFNRDGNLCVICKHERAADAHHIMERRLFSDGGYYINNGASVCGFCHLLCEQTVISPEEVREAAGIQIKVLPPQLYSDMTYDKWGNIILNPSDPNSPRIPGELFTDESVQKVLSQGLMLRLFDVNHYKYPRTFHVHTSPGATKDDRRLSKEELDFYFSGKQVLVTEKMDGECTNLCPDIHHARSLDPSRHPSHAWLNTFHAHIQGDIPMGYRVCAEYLYAKHSIHYQDLPSYLLGFSVWNRDLCLSAEDSLEWFNLLGILPVPTIYSGPFDLKIIEKTYEDYKKSKKDIRPVEGWVIRNADSFFYRDFRKNVAKFVRADHVTASVHNWRASRVTPNTLLPGIDPYEFKK